MQGVDHAHHPAVLLDSHRPLAEVDDLAPCAALGQRLGRRQRHGGDGEDADQRPDSDEWTSHGDSDVYRPARTRPLSLTSDKRPPDRPTPAPPWQPALLLGHASSRREPSSRIGEDQCCVCPTCCDPAVLGGHPRALGLWRGGSPTKADHRVQRVDTTVSMRPVPRSAWSACVQGWLLRSACPRSVPAAGSGTPRANVVAGCSGGPTMNNVPLASKQCRFAQWSYLTYGRPIPGGQNGIVVEASELTPPPPYFVHVLVYGTTDPQRSGSRCHADDPDH